MRIPIYWVDGRRGNWDHGTMMLAEEGLLSPGSPVEFESKPADYSSDQPFHTGTVICFNGNQPDAAALAKRAKRCLLVVLSDEGATFDPSCIDKSNVVWMQYGRHGRHDFAAKWLLTGLRRETPDVIAAQRSAAEDLPRIRWSFVGQKQHTWRDAFVRAVEGRGDGILHISSGFGGLGSDGFPYDSYIRLMLRSDFVLCPPGNVSPDSFRVCEALECGAIPIVTGRDYWKRVFRNNPFAPVTVVDHAAEIPNILAWDSERVAAVRKSFAISWTEYKRRFVEEIGETVASIA